MAYKSDFGTSTVLNAPSPATSGTSLDVQSGHGARFPQTPFYVTAHPDGILPTLDNAEALLVTAKSTDTLTITRAQKGTSAKSIATGWRISNAVYADDAGVGDLLTEGMFDFVASGCVWTADAAGSTRAASMSAGVVYIGGRRLKVNAVSARTFAASKDAYIDLSDNGDGTAIPNYDETVSNNGASPTLTAGRMRIGIIQTGATNIATAASINQGDPNATVPVASSVIYSVTDSLGNLIYNTSSRPGMIGYRQRTSNYTTTGTADEALAELVMPIIIPSGVTRKIRLTYITQSIRMGNSDAQIRLWDGTVGSGTVVANGFAGVASAVSGFKAPGIASRILMLSGGSTKTYRGGAQSSASGAVVVGGATFPTFIMAELEP